MTWLTDILGGIWAKLLVGGAIVLGLLAAIGIIRKGGADAQKVKQDAANQKIRDRVDAVQPPAPGETEKSLQDGKF